MKIRHYKKRLYGKIATKRSASSVTLSHIQTSKQYDRYVVMLNQLLDAGGADEKSKLAVRVNLLGDLIGDYEDAHRII